MYFLLYVHCEVCRYIHHVCIYMYMTYHTVRYIQAAIVFSLGGVAFLHVLAEWMFLLDSSIKIMWAGHTIHHYPLDSSLNLDLALGLVC